MLRDKKLRQSDLRGRARLLPPVEASRLSRFENLDSCGQRPGGFRPVAADQQSENVELAVIAQRLVQEAVRRAHGPPPRLLTGARHDGGAPIICVIAARIVWRASGSVIRRRDSSVR